jgi:riboflavin-specific deaminase-like protein
MVVHMAQTIDGMIATEQGNSQWIGNDENLMHSHRLRALVDGVIVGGTTAKIDLPRLNVRHVTGSNPARIILSDSFTETNRLPITEGMRTILLRSKAFVEANCATDDVDLIVYDEIDGRIAISSMLAELRSKGVRSVLLEGGPQTFRTFFEGGAVEFVHAHIAPMIMGSGIPMLTLPKISELADSVDVHNPFYVEMGDAIMVVGQL